MITIRAWLSILAAFLCTARPVPDNARFSSPDYYSSNDLDKVPELGKSGELSLTYYRKHKNGNGPTACAIGPDQWKPSKFVLGAISQNYFGVGPYKGAGPACGLCMRITPVKNIDGKTFDKLKAANGGSLLVKLADLCPFDAGALSDTGGGNEEWCRGKKGEKNKHGRDIHVDLMYETLPEVWKTAVTNPQAPESYSGNMYGTYTLVSCDGSGGSDNDAGAGQSNQQSADKSAQGSKGNSESGKNPTTAASASSAKKSREAATSDTADDDSNEGSRSGKSTMATDANDDGDNGNGHDESSSPGRGGKSTKAADANGESDDDESSSTGRNGKSTRADDGNDDSEDDELSTTGRSGKSKVGKCKPNDDDNESGGKCMLDGIPIDPDPDRPDYCRDYDGEPLAFKYTRCTDYKIYEVQKLGKNKGKVVKALEKAGLDKKIQRLALAMLMIETESFALKERDATKTGSSENFSIFNLNKHMAQVLLGEKQEISNQFEFALKVLTTAIGRWGVDCTLNFVRGGSTAFSKNRNAYNPQPYRDAVATGYLLMEEDEELMTDSRRVAMDVQYV